MSDNMNLSEQPVIEKKSIGNRFSGMMLSSFGLAVLALITAIIGQKIIYGQNGNVAVGLIFFLLAVIIFVIAGKRIKTPEKPFEISKKTEIFIFIGIMLVGLFYRVHMIQDMPPGFFADEGDYGLKAIMIMNGEEHEWPKTKLPVHLGGMAQMGALYFYFMAVFFKLFGVGAMQERSVSILFGMMSLSAFYFLTRKLMGVRTAIIGGFLLAVMRWHLNFSRVCWPVILSIFSVILALYYGYRMYKERKTMDFVFFGFANALAQNAYQTSRILPLWVLVFAVYLIFTDRKFYAENWKKILLSALIFGIFFAPMGHFIYKYNNQYVARARTTVIFNKPVLNAQPQVWKNVPKVLDVYVHNFFKVMLSYNHHGDWNPRANLPNAPALAFFTGIFAVLGFGYMMAVFWRLVPFFILAAFFSLIQTSLITTEAPHGARLATTIPIMILFAAFGVNRFLYYADNYFARGKKVFTVVFLTVLFILAGAVNFNDFFEKQYKHKDVQRGFSPEEAFMAKKLNSYDSSKWRGIVLLRYTYWRSFRFNVYPNKTFITFRPEETIPLNPEDDKNYVFMLIKEYFPIVPILRDLYPNGVYEEWRPKYGGYDKQEPFFFTYEVTNEELRRVWNNKGNHGLDGYYYKGDAWRGKLLMKTVAPFLLFESYENPVRLPYSMDWRGKINIENAGEYEFFLEASSTMSLTIDGKTLIDVRTIPNKYFYDGKAKIKLKKGMHTINVKYASSHEHLRMRFWWKVPGSAQKEIVPYKVLYRE